MVQGKLTRKELKRDRIRAYLVDAYEWLTENSKFLAAGLVVIALLLLGTFLWETYHESRLEELQLSFAEGLEIFHAPLSSEVTTDTVPAPKFQFASVQERNRRALEKFLEISKGNEGSQVGQLSLYYAAIAQRELGLPEDAESSLRRVISEAEQPELKAMAQDQLAALLTEQGKVQEAIEHWSAILDEPSSRFPLSYVILRLGRAYDSIGEQRKALDLYKRLRDEFPNSGESQQVRARLEYLEDRYANESQASEEVPAEQENS